MDSACAPFEMSNVSGRGAGERERERLQSSNARDAYCSHAALDAVVSAVGVSGSLRFAGEMAACVWRKRSLARESS